MLARVVVASSLVLIGGCAAGHSVEPTAFGNLGKEVNSDRDEYSPVMRDSAMLIFTSNRVNTDEAGLRESLTTDQPANLFFSMKLEDEWDGALPYEIVFDGSDRQEIATVAFARLPNRLDAVAYFSSCIGDDRVGGCDIFMVTGKSNEVSTPGPSLNSEQWDGHPYVTPDGSRLYFASDRPGGLGGTDIWYVERDGSGMWGQPVNAGDRINTDADEHSPFFHEATGDLFFAGTTQRDSLDIFVLRHDAAVREQLPSPYNSKSAEITPFILEDRLYLASDRDGGCGGYDLYSFPLEEIGN